MQLDDLAFGQSLSYHVERVDVELVSWQSDVVVFVVAGVERSFRLVFYSCSCVMYLCF